MWDFGSMDERGVLLSEMEMGMLSRDGNRLIVGSKVIGSQQSNYLKRPKLQDRDIFSTHAIVN